MHVWVCVCTRAPVPFNQPHAPALLVLQLTHPPDRARVVPSAPQVFDLNVCMTYAAMFAAQRGQYRLMNHEPVGVQLPDSIVCPHERLRPTCTDCDGTELPSNQPYALL